MGDWGCGDGEAVEGEGEVEWVVVVSVVAVA